MQSRSFAGPRPLASVSQINVQTRTGEHRSTRGMIDENQTGSCLGRSLGARGDWARAEACQAGSRSFDPVTDLNDDVTSRPSSQTVPRECAGADHRTNASPPLTIVRPARLDAELRLRLRPRGARSERSQKEPHALRATAAPHERPQKSRAIDRPNVRGWMYRKPLGTM